MSSLIAYKIKYNGSLLNDLPPEVNLTAFIDINEDPNFS